MNNHTCNSAFNYFYCILTQAVYADLRVVHRNLTHEVQNGGGHDGVDADEEVDAHIGDEGHLGILEDA